MAKQLQYGTTAKIFHWLVLALLIVQYPLGKFMPDIHRGMKPGDAMTFHISFGITILVLIVLRLLWRIIHPVTPAFFAIPLPTLPTEGSLLANSIGKWHETMEWVLLLVIGAHVAAAMAHTFIFRDRIMQRMLPEKPTVVRTKGLKPEVVVMKPARDRV